MGNVGTIGLLTSIPITLADMSESGESTTEIKFEELKSCIERDQLVVIDVRSADEIKDTGKLPGSFNIPLPEITAAFELSPEQFSAKYGFEKPAPRDSRSCGGYALTCRSGRRVGLANAEMVKLGYGGMRLYIGSIIDWKKNGGPLEMMK